MDEMEASKNHISPPICPNEHPTNWALGGSTDAGNSEAGELGGEGLSWEDGGLLN